MVTVGGALGQVDLDRADQFRRLCADVEPRLRRALVAAYGPDLGSDATAEALAWAWQHFERVEAMANPGGYLWRVGQTAIRRELRRQRRLDVPVPEQPAVEFEPRLEAAVLALPTRQRTAVLLVHGYGWSLADAAAQMDCQIRTLRNHLDRGMAKLRDAIGAVDG